MMSGCAGVCEREQVDLSILYLSSSLKQRASQGEPKTAWREEATQGGH